LELFLAKGKTKDIEGYQDEKKGKLKKLKVRKMKL